MTNPHPATQAVDWELRYQEGSTPWERPGLNPAFVAWLEEGVLAPPARVLVPGAGRGAEPLALAEAGFDVTAVDAAPSAVAVQRARLSGLHVRARVELADLFSWKPEAPFDAIYEQTCLCALPPATLPAYAARLRSWLKPGGRLFALFMQTGDPGGPPFHCDLDAMRALFAQGWTWPDRLGPKVELPSGRHEIPAVLTAL